MNTWRNALFAMVSAACLDCAHAGFYDGNKVLALCESQMSFDQGLCVGYSAGIADAWDNVRKVSGNESCLRETVTIGQVRDVIMKYLKENPAQRDEGANGIGIRALYAAFCKKA